MTEEESLRRAEQVLADVYATVNHAYPISPTLIRDVAEVIREAVAIERVRCEAIVDREREEDGDTEQLRNLLAAIREGSPPAPAWTREGQ